jgi:putative Holliday junction resolvase
MESSAVMSEAGHGSKAGRVLALDYGRKRLGIAISDPLGVTAQPYATWTRRNMKRELARLRNLCREEAISRIVVGRPLQLGGSEGEMALEAGRFAERVRNEVGIPVELVDERLSTWEARQTLTENARKSRSRRQKRRQLDEVAAAVILRDYLSRGTGAS